MFTSRAHKAGVKLFLFLEYSLILKLLKIPLQQVCYFYCRNIGLCTNIHDHVVYSCCCRECLEKYMHVFSSVVPSTPRCMVQLKDTWCKPSHSFVWNKSPVCHPESAGQGGDWPLCPQSTAVVVLPDQSQWGGLGRQKNCQLSKKSRHILTSIEGCWQKADVSLAAPTQTVPSPVFFAVWVQWDHGSGGDHYDSIMFVLNMP